MNKKLTVWELFPGQATDPRYKPCDLECGEEILRIYLSPRCQLWPTSANFTASKDGMISGYVAVTPDIIGTFESLNDVEVNADDLKQMRDVIESGRRVFASNTLNNMICRSVGWLTSGELAYGDYALAVVFHAMEELARDGIPADEMSIDFLCTWNIPGIVAEVAQTEVSEEEPAPDIEQAATPAIDLKAYAAGLGLEPADRREARIILKGLNATDPDENKVIDAAYAWRGAMHKVRAAFANGAAKQKGSGGWNSAAVRSGFVAALVSEDATWDELMPAIDYMRRGCGDLDKHPGLESIRVWRDQLLTNKGLLRHPLAYQVTVRAIDLFLNHKVRRSPFNMESDGCCYSADQYPTIPPAPPLADQPLKG